MMMMMMMIVVSGCGGDDSYDDDVVYWTVPQQKKPKCSTGAIRFVIACLSVCHPDKQIYLAEIHKLASTGRSRRGQNKIID